MAGNICILATSSSARLGAGGDAAPSGAWLEEVAAPLFTWKQQGYSVVLGSVAGGAIPWDAASMPKRGGSSPTPACEAFLTDPGTAAAARDTPSAAALLRGAERFDALFIPGGHGICFDGPASADLKALAEKVWAAGGVLAAMCHGPAALCAPVLDAGGEPVVKGRRVCAFSNEEERLVGKDKLVPFLLEDRLKELGAVYEAGPAWAPRAVADGRLVTGQNPASSARVAELVHEVLSQAHRAPTHEGKAAGEGFKHRARAVTAERHHEHRGGVPHGVKAEDAARHPQYHKDLAHHPVRSTAL